MINGERLWASLMDLARIGGTPKGGVRRITLTEADREGRDLFVRWARDAGLTVRWDAVGNIFARRPGSDPLAAPVVMGSHLDSQPSGGKFDGAYGVMAGLEVVRTLNDRRIATRAPIEVASWTNEEGSRFVPVMMGSGVFAGVFRVEHVLAAKDTDGISAGRALKDIGYAGDAPAHEIDAYFEAHIEQGPVLEDTRTTIGVVQGALGQRWFDVRVYRPGCARRADADGAAPRRAHRGEPPGARSQPHRADLSRVRARHGRLHAGQAELAQRGAGRGTHERRSSHRR